MTRTYLAAFALIGCSLPLGAGNDHKIVNGYFPEWGIYATPNPFFVKSLVLSGNAARLTHLSYAFGLVKDGVCTLADPWADVQRPFTANESVNGLDDSVAATALHGNFNQLVELKSMYPNLKIVISLGGGGVAAPFVQASANPAARKKFIASCVDMFINGNFGQGVASTPGIFDGIDIDWEYPTAADTVDLVDLTREFRQALDAVRPGFVLTLDSPAGQWAYQNINLPETVKPLDFYNVMTYDYNGPWQNSTGFVAPLYQTPFDPDANNNVDATIRGYFDAGVPASKMVLGIPFYAYGWTVSGDTQAGQYVAGVPVDQGDAFTYIETLMSTFKEYRDPQGKTPFLFNGKQFWTYDDPVSIREKIRYARAKGLAGAMVWNLSDDLPDGNLLGTIVANLNADE